MKINVERGKRNKLTQKNIENTKRLAESGRVNRTNGIQAENNLVKKKKKSSK